LSKEALEAALAQNSEFLPSGSAESGLVFRSVVPVTMIDYPGKLAYTVCTLGCNFRCPICHNRELALGLTDGLPEYSVSTVLAEIEGKGGWVDGICITGGEPLLQPGLRAALKRFRDAGLGVKIDTNGSFPAELKALLDDEVVDYVAMDVKAPLTEAEYARSTGVSMQSWLARIEESIAIIKSSGVEYEFRTVCVPGMHSPESISRIAERLVRCSRYVLSAFRPMNTLDPAFEQVLPPTTGEMDAYLRAARVHLPAATIGHE
jgi:pyruvate formate lyase activating enzyme